MGLFSNIIKSRNQLGGGWDTVNQAIQRVWSKPPRRDTSDLPELFHKNPRLSGVAAIARAVASTPYQVFNKIDYRQNGDAAKPIYDHDVLDLLENPITRYPEMDSYFLFYTVEALTKLVGECFLLKVRDEHTNKVIELDIIPPAWVQMTPTMGNPYYLVYPYGSTSARALTVSPDDMIVFRRPNLSDPYGRGRGDSEPLEQEFIADENMANMQSNFAYNDATPPYIITAPGMPKDAADAFKQSWLQKLGGMGHRREPGILGFDAKIQTLAMSPVELDMIESRKFIRDMSSEHYQIPPEILGRIENSNRATIDSAFYLYNRNVLCYEYGFIERAITRQLVATEYDKGLVFKFDPDIPEDEDRKLSTMNAGLAGGVVQIDEWRKAFDLPELPNNKGKVFLRTFAQYEVPADGRSEPEEMPPSNPTTPEGNPTGETEDKPTEDPNMEAPKDDTAKAIIRIVSKSVVDSINCDNQTTIKIVSDKAGKKDDSRRIAIWKAFDSKATSKEAEFIQAVKRYSASQKKRVIDALDSKKLDTAISSGGAYVTEIESALKSVFNDSANKALKSALAPAWTDTLEAGIDHAHEMIGANKSKAIKAPRVDPSFSVKNKLVNEYIESVGLLKAEGINDTTNDKLRKKLQDAISEGISNGDNLNTIKNSILDICENVYDEMDAVRAKMIARTESAGAMNAGGLMGARADGMTHKQWLSQIDERTRGSDPDDEFDHINCDGETVEIDEPFVMTGQPMQYPLDPAGDAGNCVNCRCTCLWLTDDMAED